VKVDSFSGLTTETRPFSSEGSLAFSAAMTSSFFPFLENQVTFVPWAIFLAKKVYKMLFFWTFLNQKFTKIPLKKENKPFLLYLLLQETGIISILTPMLSLLYET